MVGARGKVVALDVNQDMLLVARALPAPTGATIEWLEGNALSLDLSDDAFDVVLCQQGLQFFPDRPAALREMRRVLTEGGRVAISVWQALQRTRCMKRCLKRQHATLGATIADVELSFSLWDVDELRTLLGDAGFSEPQPVLITHETGKKPETESIQATDHGMSAARW